MKIALLGIDADILRLAQAARNEGHQITWVGDVRPLDSPAIHQLADNPADRSGEWELLLDGAIADVVLVGRGQASAELRNEQLKRLAVETIPLLVVHPVGLGVLSYYELDMTRRETRGVVRHYNPLAGHPALAELAQWIRDGHPTIGPIHQLSCERRLNDDSRDSALAYLARDAELLAAVAGDIQRVTAVGPQSPDASFATLQVQMTAATAASLRWSVRSSRAATAGLELALIGAAGGVVLQIAAPATNELAVWESETTSDDRQYRRTLEPYDPAATAVRELAEAVAAGDAVPPAAKSTWDAATRALEVVDAVELSLEKGRTIDVVQQQLTERLAFRGTMAALGCGLLLVGLAAIIFVTLLGGAEGVIGRRLVPGWPLVLLAVLAFFLLLQVVPLLARRPKGSAGPAAPDRQARDGS